MTRKKRSTNRTPPAVVQAWPVRVKARQNESPDMIRVVYATIICIIALGCAKLHCSPTEKQNSYTNPVYTGIKVEVRNITDNTAPQSGDGLFATTDISQGEVIVMVDPWDMLPNGSMKKEGWYKELLLLAEDALASIDSDNKPSVEDVMTGITLLMELDKGEKSQWHEYIKTLPRDNLTRMSWYWTEDEMRCVVPLHKAAERQRRNLKNFHAVFEEVSRKFLPLTMSVESSQDELRNRAEWAYRMAKTRGFRAALIPILDAANHDPTRSVSIFTTDATASLVATQDIKAGEQVFASYGKLVPSQTAATYGFVDPNTAFVNVPSIGADLRESPLTNELELCTKREMLFFGNVTEGRVEARMKNLQQTTYFKAFHPAELAYQCVRVLIQSECGPKVASYMAEKLQQDAETYEAMAHADHCQSTQGNFPLIRESNAVTARLLRGALEVARRAERKEIDYPGVPYP